MSPTPGAAHTAGHDVADEFEIALDARAAGVEERAAASWKYGYCTAFLGSLCAEFPDVRVRVAERGASLRAAAEARANG